MAFAKKELQHYRKLMQKHMDEFAKEVGMQVTVAHITYSDMSFTAKVEVVKAETKAEAEKALFIEASKVFSFDGMTPEHYGKTFVMNNNTYKLVGLHPKRAKYPLVVEKDGQRYKMPLSKVVKKKLGLKINEWDE
jgi:hypothetical protein